MHMTLIFPDASAELAVAAVAAAAALIASVIVRIVLCTLAASATRKALEDLIGGQTDANALRAHRLAVLQAVLGALNVHGHAQVSTDDTQRVLPAQHVSGSPELMQSTSEISADDFN